MTRRKIVVTGTGEAARTSALLLARRDDAELVLLDEDATPLNAAAPHLGFEPRATGPASWPQTSGSDLVVALRTDDDTARELARHCPDAVVILATPDAASGCAGLQEVLRWPRSRLLGVPPEVVEAGPVPTAAAVARLVDAVLADRRRPVDAVVLHTGENGVDGWEAAPVRVGGSGVEDFC